MESTQFTVRANNSPLIDEDSEGEESVGVVSNSTIDNETVLDIVASSTHSGGSAGVTLPPEEVLRLTKAESGRILNQNHFNVSINNNSSSAAAAVPPSFDSQLSQATVDSNVNDNAFGELEDHPSVTLPIEQVLQLTMSNGEDEGEEDNSSSNNNNNTPAKSDPRRTSKTKKTKRKNPNRTKSGSSTGSAGKLKKAVKKEKKSMEAVVAAAIRNYGGDDDQNDSSPLKTERIGKKKGATPSPRKKKKRGRKPPSDKERVPPLQRQQPEEVPPGPSPSELFHQEAEALPTDDVNEEGEDDYDVEAPLPTQLSEQVSSASFQSFQSIDRAGAIAVFPNDSSHITQRRSISRPITDMDYDIDFNQILAEEKAKRESSSRDLSSTNKTFEEIPEPPVSQVINATATHIYPSSPTPPSLSLPPQPHASTTTDLQQTQSQIPRSSTGSQSWTTSSAASVSNDTNTARTLQTLPSQPSPARHTLSQDSSSDNDDEFLGAGSLGDAESGTVTAKAISSEDYYEEVRRQLRQEAVVAVDVIPLREDGLPRSAGTSNNVNVYGATTSQKAQIQNGKSEYDGDDLASNPRNSQRVKNKHLWICGAVGGGILILALIIVVAVFVNQRQFPISVVGIPTQSPSIGDDGMFFDEGAVGDDDMSQGMMNLTKSEKGKYWRKVISEILPKDSLISALIDPNYMSPHYMAYIYLVEHANEFFGDFDVDYKLTELEESMVSTVFALVTLYYSLDGPDWYAQQNWLDPTKNFCEWQGVNCKGDPITKQIFPTSSATDTDARDISIPFEGLLDIPPPGDLDDLFDVEEEEVSTSNGFDDFFFSEGDFHEGADDVVVEGEPFSQVYDADDAFNDATWGGFFDHKIAIHSLDLQANGLLGTLPNEIGLLTNIYGGINLSTNAIYGSIPSQMGMLSKLQCMILHSNTFENELPTHLGRMTNLRKFDISGNADITGTVPSTLKHWNRIEEIEIQNTGLGGRVPQEFCQTVETRENFNFKHVESLAFRATCKHNNPVGDHMGVVCLCCTECCHQDQRSSKELCVPAPPVEDD